MFQAPEHFKAEVFEFENGIKNLDDYINDFCTKFEETEWFLQRPDHIKELYRKYPAIGFYRIKSTGRPTRITGFHELENGSINAQTHNFMLGMDILNSTIGGWSLDDLERVDKWSKEDLENMEGLSMANPDLVYVYRHPMDIVFLTE